MSWAGWRPATCLPSDCFCEAIRDGAIAQPANTWSGLAFVVVAIGIALAGAREARTRVLAVAVLLTGLGTMLYHASLTFVGQFADLMGMYLLITFLLLQALARRWPAACPRTFVASYVIANALLAVPLYHWPELRRVIFGVLVVATLLAEVGTPLRVGSRGHLWWAAGVLAVGFAIWIVDWTRLACDPTSPLQGHAVWHVCGAIAAWLMFEYSRQGAS